jgi:hypothetical protein
MKPLRVNNKLSWECKLRIGGEVNTIADWLKKDPQKLYDRFTVNKVKGEWLQHHIWVALMHQFAK